MQKCYGMSKNDSAKTYLETADQKILEQDAHAIPCLKSTWPGMDHASEYMECHREKYFGKVCMVTILSFRSSNFNNSVKMGLSEMRSVV